MNDMKIESTVKKIEMDRIWRSNIMSFLHENEKTIYNMFYNSKDIVIVFANDDNDVPDSILDANDIACDKLGYSKVEFLQLSLEKLGIYLNTPRADKIKEDLLANQYTFFKINLLHKTGSNIPIEVSASLLNIEDKKAVLIVAKDITDFEVIEKRLTDNNIDLKIALDDLKMMQQKLIQQEKLVAIGQLAAGVAHEINNPLGYIYSNVETSRLYFKNYENMFHLYEDYIDSLEQFLPKEMESRIKEIKELKIESGLDFISTDIQELYDDVEGGLKKISEIVTSLKTFSRVDKPGELEEYNLNEGIRNTLMIARNEIKYHARVIEILNDIPMVRAKGNQIDQVLLNLFLNAAHGVKAREINDLGSIIVSTNTSDGYVFCNIEDNGIGIEEKNIEKIFNPFFTTKVIGQGTGLGLSIAYDIIVNKCGGEILVTSIPNVKTKFTIKLPINKIEEDLF